MKTPTPLVPLLAVQSAAAVIDGAVASLFPLLPSQLPEIRRSEMWGGGVGLTLPISLFDSTAELTLRIE
jgi:hypothetical protein